MNPKQSENNLPTYMYNAHEGYNKRKLKLCFPNNINKTDLTYVQLLVRVVSCDCQVTGNRNKHSVGTCVNAKRRCDMHCKYMFVP